MAEAATELGTGTRLPRHRAGVPLEAQADVSPAQVAAQSKASALAALLRRWRQQVFELLVHRTMAQQDAKRYQAQLARCQQRLHEVVRTPLPRGKRAWYAP